MQEEVYFVVKGSGTMQVRGRRGRAEAGPLRHGVDPTAVRLTGRGGPSGLEFIAFGAPIDTPYEPPPWG